MNKQDKDLCLNFIQASKGGNDLPDITPIIKRYNLFHKYFKQILSEYELVNKTFTYMLTFTMDQKKQDVDLPFVHNAIEEYIVKFAERREPLRADLVCEGTDKDHKHKHWHLGIETKKYIDFSNFLKYYRNLYGNVDVSKSWSNDYNNILKYINKSKPSFKVV